MQDVNLHVCGLIPRLARQNAETYLYQASLGCDTLQQELWKILITQLLGAAILSWKRKLRTLPIKEPIPYKKVQSILPYHSEVSVYTFISQIRC